MLRQHLRQDGLQRRGAAHVSATTRGGAFVDSIVGTRLRAILTVEELVAERAHVTAGADEDAGVHITQARRALNAHAVAAHVDFTRNVNDTPLAEGELAPGV